MPVSGTPNNNMVEKVDSEQIGRASNPVCQMPVHTAGQRISRWMIMEQDESIGFFKNNRMENISRVCDSLVHPSLG